jgi:hypothetical protein
MGYRESENGIFNLEVLGEWATIEIREASSKMTVVISPDGRIAIRWKSAKWAESAIKGVRSI